MLRITELAGRRRAFVPLALSALTLAVAFYQPAAFGRQATEPRREQLLNGLRVLLLHRPSDPDVLIRLRIHSGAAFDLAGKEGMTALLAEAMFGPEDFRFVEEDLGGSLEVTTGYDSVDLTVRAPAKDFDRLLGLLRASLMNVQLTPETVSKLREERQGKLSADRPSPADAADRAVAFRLFHPHPYGRVTTGTPESVGRVEYSDLLLARDRFISPNNTTLVVIGGVEPRTVMRSLRQSLGGWRKSDRLVPATFRRPEPPDPRTLVVNSPAACRFEVRVAFRGLPRADRDRPAAEVLAALASARLAAAAPELSDVKVAHRAFLDGGIFLIGASAGSAAEAAKALAAARTVVRELTARPVESGQFEAARQSVSASLLRGTQGDGGAASVWLDAQTYASEAATDAGAARAVRSLTPADVLRVASRLSSDSVPAAVALGDAAALREEFARSGGAGVEVSGEAEGKADKATSPRVKEAQKQPGIQLKRPF